MTVVKFNTRETIDPPCDTEPSRTLKDFPWDPELGRPRGTSGDVGIREPYVDINIPVTKPKNVLTSRLNELLRECFEVAKKKNADYASDDDPFANFNGCTKYGISVPRGMLVRMEDKMKRIANLLDKPAMVNGESIYDSCLDLANYALILRTWLEMNEPADTDAAGYHGC